MACTAAYGAGGVEGLCKEKGTAELGGKTVRISRGRAAQMDWLMAVVRCNRAAEAGRVENAGTTALLPQLQAGQAEERHSAHEYWVEWRRELLPQAANIADAFSASPVGQHRCQLAVMSCRARMLGRRQHYGRMAFSQSGRPPCGLLQQPQCNHGRAVGTAATVPRTKGAHSRLTW